MKYPYIVVKDGIWYPSGADVPEGIFDNENSVSYTKSEINRMPISELRILAGKEKIPDFEEKKGSELKKLLIQKYGL